MMSTHVVPQLDLAHSPVHYHHAGAGFPVVLLHGWGGSSRYWDSTLAALADEHALYAPDLPGYGQTSPLPDAITSERLAEWVIAFADSVGLDRFDLDGHSFSANVAIHVAARWPERVRRLVLTCFSTFRNERERHLVNQVHRVLALWMALRRPWMGQRRVFYRAVARRFFYRMPNDNETLRQSFADFLQMDKRTALESAASAGSPSIIPAMQAVAAPTLLIGARQDNIMPQRGTPVVAAHIHNCRLVWIERCGHLPMIERPDVYHPLLREFLG